MNNNNNSKQEEKQQVEQVLDVPTATGARASDIIPKSNNIQSNDKILKKEIIQRDSVTDAQAQTTPYEPPASTKQSNNDEAWPLPDFRTAIEFRHHFGEGVHKLHEAFISSRDSDTAWRNLPEPVLQTEFTPVRSSTLEVEILPVIQDAAADVQHASPIPSPHAENVESLENEDRTTTKPMPVVAEGTIVAVGLPSASRSIYDASRKIRFTKLSITASISPKDYRSNMVLTMYLLCAKTGLTYSNRLVEEFSHEESENMKKRSGRGRRPKHYLTSPSDKVTRKIDTNTMSCTFDFAINKVSSENGYRLQIVCEQDDGHHLTPWTSRKFIVSTYRNNECYKRK